MELNELTTEAINHIIANMGTDRLTKWEQDFFESICDQWENRKFLSDKQKLTLGKIWDKQS